MLFRFLLWLIILYISWKVLRIFSHHTNHPKERHDVIPPFSNIEEAEFKDLTPKSQSSDDEQPPPESKE